MLLFSVKKKKKPSLQLSKFTLIIEKLENKEKQKIARDTPSVYIFTVVFVLDTIYFLLFLHNMTIKVFSVSLKDTAFIVRFFPWTNHSVMKPSLISVNFSCFQFSTIIKAVVIFTFMRNTFSTWVVISWMNFRRGLYSLHNFWNANRFCQRILSNIKSHMKCSPGSRLYAGLKTYSKPAT